MADDAIRAALAGAWRELLAALAVEADAGCGPELVAVHVVRAWVLVHAAVEREPADLGRPEIAAWAGGQSSRFVGADGAQRVSAYLEQARGLVSSVGGELPEALRTPAATEEQLAALRARLVDERRRAGLAPAAESTRGVWLKRAAKVAAAALVVLVVGLRPWELQGVGQWRGAYYPGKDLRGDPDIRRHADVAFDWGLAPPTDSIPSDRFAARWDTCLVLEEGQPVTFQLVADDGARLFIDGELTLDGWALPMVPGSIGGEVELEAGVHHLRVEYREESGTASIHFMATFDAALPPGPIPSRMLQYPAEDVDATEPCAHVDP